MDLQTAAQRKLRPASSGDSGTSLRDILTVLFRYKWEIITFFSITVITATVMTYLAPEIFASNAKILIRMGRESVAMDPTVVGPTFNVQQSRESEVNSELAVLSSQYLVEEVVDQFGPDRFLNRPDAEPLTDDVRKKLRVKAINLMSRNLTVEVEKNSHIITLSLELQDPQLAREALDSLIGFYMARHIEVHRTQASPEFFEQQAARLLHDLAQKEAQLEEFRSTYSIASVADQKAMLIEQINELQKEVDNARGAINSSQSKVASLDKAIQGRSQAVELERTTGISNSAADEIKKKLFDLKLMEKDLSARYPDDFRGLIDVRDRIKLAESELAKEDKTRTQVRIGLDSNYRSLLLELEKEQAEMTAAKARWQTLASELAVRKQELSTLAEQEMTVTRLQRDIEILDKEYKEYRDNLQRARISTALDVDNVSNVSIVQPATLPTRPVAPNKKLNIFLGLVLGLSGGIGLAFFLEFINDSLKTADEVERRLGLPVLASVSRKEFETCT